MSKQKITEPSMPTGRPTIISANRTGGQGKTLVAHLLHYACWTLGQPLRLVAADSIGDATSKLGKLFPGEVRELGLGASLAELQATPSLAYAHWDGLLDEIAQGAAIVDLGANLVNQVWDWARATGIGSLLQEMGAPPIDLIVPARAQRQAVEDALDLLEMSFLHDEAFPIRRRVLLLNEAGESFERYGDAEDLKRVECMRDQGLIVTTLPCCTSELWPTIDRQSIPFSAVTGRTPREVASQFELPLAKAARGLVNLSGWVRESCTNLHAAGLLPDLGETTA